MKLVLSKESYFTSLDWGQRIGTEILERLSWSHFDLSIFPNKRLLDGVSTDWNDDQDDAAAAQVGALVEAQLSVADKRTTPPPPSLRGSTDRGFDSWEEDWLLFLLGQPEVVEAIPCYQSPTGYPRCCCSLLPRSRILLLLYPPVMTFHVPEKRMSKRISH